jgi:hypothetical protein
MYLLDSSILMDAKNRYYAFDLVPPFWRWLEEAHQAAKVFTVQQVADEIYAGHDDLSTWLRAQPSSFRIAVEASDQPALKRVAQWANSGRFKPGAVNTFLAAADYFLVVQALTRGYTVVTGETIADPKATARIKIPDACLAVGVPCISLFQMLKDEGVRFG